MYSMPTIRIIGIPFRSQALFTFYFLKSKDALGQELNQETDHSKISLAT